MFSFRFGHVKLVGKLRMDPPPFSGQDMHLSVFHRNFRSWRRKGGGGSEFWITLYLYTKRPDFFEVKKVHLGLTFGACTILPRFRTQMHAPQCGGIRYCEYVYRTHFLQATPFFDSLSLKLSKSIATWLTLESQIVNS